MKRVFYVLILFAVFALHNTGLHAGPIDTVTAKLIAKHYFNSMNEGANRTDNDIHLVLQMKTPFQINAADGSTHSAKTPVGQKKASSPGESPCFYVINFDPAGFVIVSADNRAAPILAYSATDHFDSATLPDGMRALLNGFVEEILALGPADTALPAIQQRWQALGSGLLPPAARSGNSVQPLIQTHWGQCSDDSCASVLNCPQAIASRATYNKFCPLDNSLNGILNATNRHAYVGCCATALAQIIRYWEYPYVGKGKHAYKADFSNKGYGDYDTLRADFGSSYYNYDLMPAQISIESPVGQIDAVAQLSYHCGVAMDMMYGPSESGVKMTHAMNALTQYFRYPNGGQILVKDNYSETAWCDILKGELDAGRPVMYRAADTTKGKDAAHIFICDGYDSDNKFHFNWGWRGKYENTFFSISAMTPGTHNYFTGHVAIIGIGTGLELEKPIVTTEIISCNSQSITVKGILLRKGDSNVTETGFVYSTSTGPTISNATKIQVTRDANQTFQQNITNLQPNITYYVRAYATNAQGTAYGEEVTAFTSDQITVIYHKNDGSQTSASQQHPSCGSSTISYEFSRPGYQLRVWNTEADGSGISFMNDWSYTLNLMNTGTIHLYAIWNGNAACTVAQVKGNETGSGSTITAVQDHQGNSYGVVQIGSQCWMSENLRCTTTPSGMNLFVQLSNQMIHPVVAYHVNGSSDNDLYGLLYTWYAAYDISDTVSDGTYRRGICPEGWHLPTAGSDGDWGVLTKTLKSSENSSLYRCGFSANNIAKSLASVRCWYSSQVDCAVGNDIYENNKSGFNMLPLGGHFGNDGFGQSGNKALLWSASAKNTEKAYVGTLSYDVSTFQMGNESKTYAFPVRCVRDTTPSVAVITPDGQPCPVAPTMTDADGNTYNTVKIGNQCWMKENLRTTKMADGASIFAGGSNVSFTDPLYYNYSSLSLPLEMRGYQYNWSAAMVACPSGWHLPSDAEWTMLTDYVKTQSDFVCGDNINYIAKALASTEGWSSSSGECNPGDQSIHANNASGFAAVPAGACYESSFTTGGYEASFWSSTEDESGYEAYIRIILSDYKEFYRDINGKFYGYPARCLRNGNGTDVAIYPTVSTSAVNNITATSAICGGNVTADGGAPVTARGVCWSTEHHPTIESSKTTDSTGTGEFTSTLAGLADSTTYYVRAYATNSAGTAYGQEISFTTLRDGQPCPNAPFVTDHDGNVYNTVKIGEQCWMKENLRTTKKADGTSLPTSSNSTSISQPYYYSFDNSLILYNWHAALEVCPTGWHLPNNAEWAQLTSYLGNLSAFQCGGNSNYIAKALASETGWNAYSGECYPGDQSLHANNASGFGAVPVGHCISSTLYSSGEKAEFWSASEEGAGSYTTTLSYGNATVSCYSTNRGMGFSVRCLHNGDGDSAAGLPTVSTSTVGDITSTTATGGGIIFDDGGAAIISRGVCWSTGSHPTMANSYSVDGTGTGVFTSGITGLVGSTTYYVRAYATNSAGTAYGQEISFTTASDGLPCPGTPTVTDYDGNVYNTVKIGDQCWMKENLRTTRYSNGISIAAGSSYSSSVAYRYAPNNDENNVPIYGYLYNRRAAMRGTGSSSSNPSGIQGVCPTGWHVPSSAEWAQLTDYVKSIEIYRCGGGSQKIAKALSATTGWTSSTYDCAVGNNPGINNATGFSALPAGYLDWDVYRDFANRAFFWNTTSDYRYILYANNDVGTTSAWQFDALSVRCVLNDIVPATVSLPSITTDTVSSIYSTSALCGGHVTSDGGGNLIARGVCWSTSPLPDLSCNHTFDGIDTGFFISHLTGLSPRTSYHVRAYVTNSAGTSYGDDVSFYTTESAGNASVSDGQYCPGTPTVTDYDGNVYNTVVIGEQCWMKENLRTSHFSDGTSIYSNGSISYSDLSFVTACGGVHHTAPYGYLYNWYTVMNGAASSDANPSGVQGVCPNGWHVPSNSEWTQLTDYVSSQNQYWCNSDSNYISKALASTTEWCGSPYECSVGIIQENNNATGFSALPAGSYDNDYHCSGFSQAAYFWSSTQASSSIARTRELDNVSKNVNNFVCNRTDAFSVRCLRNVSVSEGNHVEDIYFEQQHPSESSTDQGDISNLNACMVYSPQPNETTAPQLATPNYHVITQVSDHQNNAYQVVQIGSQCWLRQNMRCTTSPTTGTYLVDNTSHLSYAGKKAYLQETTTGNDSYGLLYNWNAATDTFNTAFGETSTSNLASAAVDMMPTGNRRGICPEGWHIPSANEWTELNQFVGSQPDYWCDFDDESTAKPLASTTGWSVSGMLSDCNPAYDTATNNATGFSALPAGWCIGGIQGRNSLAAFTSLNGNLAFGIAADEDTLWTAASEKSYGLSVRCVRNTLPVVATKTVSSLSPFETLTGGEVLSEGDAPVMERGVICRNQNGSNVMQTSDGSGPGSYVSALTDLQPDADYEVRAYAANSYGVSYGEWIAFHTPCLSFYTEDTRISCGNYLWDDTLITQTGTYTRTFASQTGCDSTVQLHLTILDNNVFDTTIHACGSYLYRDSLYTHSQTIHDSISEYGNCTLFINVNLFVQEAFTVTSDTAIGTYMWHGQEYTQSGTYWYPYTTSEGCSVIDTLHLTIVYDPSFDALPCPGHETVTDIDGNQYNTVQIGDQCWMKENLRTTRYADGSNISLSSGSMSGTNPYRYLPNDNSNTVGTYGYLYNWAAAMHGDQSSNSSPSDVQGICPNGWHLPSDTEWTQLTDYVSSQNQYLCGEDSAIARSLAASTDWEEPYWDDDTCAVGYNLSSNNATGFSALPAGYFDYELTYIVGQGFVQSELGSGQSFGDQAIFWSSTEHNADYAYYRGLSSTFSSVSWGFADSKEEGLSVRCVRDKNGSTSALPFVTTENVTSIASTSASCGGNVTADGGATVTTRGICWSTSHNPTIGSSHTTDGTGTGTFTSNITGLTPNTTYFVRAYATNSAGTAYGEEKTFTTPCNNLTVSISGPSSIDYGQSATLTASGATTYVWSTGATTASITVSPTSTTTYSVTGTNQYGCTATASKTVTVNSLLPTVITNNVTNVAQTSATCGGNVTADGGATVTARGVCWSTSHNPTVNDSHTSNGSGTGSFTSNITGLTPNTTYYVRAYATNSAGTAYGEEKTFTTPCNALTVSITGPSSIDYGQSATLTASGATTYVWSTGANTTNITVSPTSTTTYTVTGTDQYGCSTSASKTVTVNSLLPTVTTSNVANIASTSATCGGNVTADGGATVTARGVCWSTSHNPTIGSSHTTDGSGTGSFTSNITGLTPNTTYYVKAYATNSAGTAYGEEKSFTTPCNTVTVSITGNSTISYGQSTTLTASGANTYVWSNGESTAAITVSPTGTTTYSVTGTDPYGCSASASKTVTVNSLLPTIVTSNVANVAQTSATCGGNVTADGGATVTARGVCWSTSHNPTVNDSHTSNGSGTGAFTSNITGLTPNTTYYVRAYATNSAGTAYGEEKTFKTPCNTFSVSISGNSTISYGQSTTLTASGANTYTWSTGATTASITVSPTSTATYTVTGTDQYGCSASASKTVTVNSLLPTVVTNNVANVAQTSASGGGNVTADGGATVTARGVCWSTSHNPTVNDSHTSNGSGTGSFTSNITGLTPNTTYYVRAYATNSAGTAYGEEKTFTTPCNALTVSISGPSSIEYGQSATLTASGASTYTWSTGATTASITVSPTSTTTYTVTGTDQYGCSASASKTVTVNSLLPTVTTSNVSNIAQTSASCGGNVTADGGATVTARGVCWSTSHNPTIGSSHTTDGSGTGSFTSNITGLTPNTTYYVRAYATNGAGTAYGEEKTFTTPCNALTVTITGNSTISYGQSTTLTASGASTYTWSTGANTTNITVSPTSTTTYSVTGTDPYGCATSASKTVTVNSLLPTVVTSNVANVAQTSATCGGNVTADGGATVTARGVCWSTSHNPTVSGSHTSDGSGTGSFTSNITGLTPNTTYYVRAYATNSAGTAYGEEKTFTTPCNALTVTITGNSSITCGQSTTLTASGANTYTWSTGANTAAITVNLTNSTSYTVTGTNLYGCTGSATITISVSSPSPGDTTAVACESFDWYEYTAITQSGNYTRLFTTAAGCDSLVTLHLTVNHGTHNVVYETACESFVWHGVTYSQSGTYTYPYTNSNGCQSMDTLHLTVNHGTHNVEYETACGSYVWHGVTYSQSGTYIHSYTNSNGCPSVDTLHLTVYYGAHHSQTETACESFVWHGTTYSQSGTYTYSYTNNYGCPSVDTLHLTILNGTHSVEYETACESYTWHGATYSLSGTYTYFYTNDSGCPSMDSLLLTVVEPPVMTEIQGESLICKNQFADYYYDISNNNYLYRWFWNNSLLAVNVPSVTLHEQNSSTSSLTMQVSDNQSICLSETTIPVTVSDNFAPDTTIVQRKTNSNMLICQPVHSEYGDVHYRWGYTHRNTHEEIIMDGDQNYCLFNIGIDTLNYAYWVDTYITYADGQSCANRSYYGHGYTTSTEAYDSDIVEAYILGNQVFLTINAANPSDINASLYNVSGKLLLTRAYSFTDHVSDVLPVSMANGVYFLKVTLGGRLYTVKLLKM